MTLLLMGIVVYLGVMSNNQCISHCSDTPSQETLLASGSHTLADIRSRGLEKERSIRYFCAFRLRTFGLCVIKVQTNKDEAFNLQVRYEDTAVLPSLSCTQL
ncbi:uncharacterized protein F5147DRAFT_717027 [Suillus discolor]|uniref:Secreted protein n=1 Tax=Suillus discolor TaxID=1912936 RepID=A0A9P7EX18_9AGAM|nr:uncharacterized protein F5147DRAFT_717027 [Suillus discolor]KAG2096082.1 hypothetical protein F5147DRAFT_717027 [Suillus discolor]